MAYEKLKLCNAMMSGEIYLAREESNGVMGNSRRIITDEVLGATADWFLGNKKDFVNWKPIDEEAHPYLFFTTDLKKAEKIKAILEAE
ncbi:DUF7446 family protein [Listeria fleischmannii]|uniref:DUF7446 family protein n=1 Tax=Listeria fleischmannii TaxID=1069827 RepID=UPI000254F9C1|nr:hypothetical protein [Listeria fleischmannii]EIA21397.1 hypothetical protein KKC_01367 [Listeria fleischmannii subsp. coloradonensis]STY35279.1 Uncharacterised protein [Listeria fleischmannii subsp. coloradonensis]